MGSWWLKNPYQNDEILNLDWVLTKLKEFENRLTTIEDVAKELIEGLKEINAIKVRLSEIEQEISDLDILRQQIADCINDIEDLNNRDAELQGEINDLQQQINNIVVRLDNVLNYIDSRIAEVYAYIDENDYILLLKINQAKATLQQEIDNLAAIIEDINTTVYNSWIDREVSNQENSDFAFNHLADECLTASQYDTLGLTADEYAALQITSRDYQEFGKDKLHFNWVLSPVEGFKQEINNVLCSIVNYIAGTLTASQYADMDLTADEYAALDLTSAQYFSYNPFLVEGFVKVDPTGIGLTTEQYSHLTI